MYLCNYIYIYVAGVDLFLSFFSSTVLMGQIIQDRAPDLGPRYLRIDIGQWIKHIGSHVSSIRIFETNGASKRIQNQNCCQLSRLAATKDKQQKAYKHIFARWWVISTYLGQIRPFPQRIRHLKHL